MSLSLINKLYKGCLFIQDGKNYLVESVREINDTDEKISVWLVTDEADIEIYNGSYSDFIFKVVK